MSRRGIQIDPVEVPPGGELGRVAAAAGLFFATAASMVVTALASMPVEVSPDENLGFIAVLERAYADQTARGGALAMAAALLAILVAHEAGHYVAARLHGVEVSLPQFLPFPLLSPFGTLGAVMRMPRPVRDRTKLFDLGAAGPLAGLVVALPLYAYGVATSERVPRAQALARGLELGSSLVSVGLEELFAPKGDASTDLVLSPLAFGAWGGLLLTMLNLLPIGQLDGGHVATALFGNRWSRGAGFLHRAMLGAFFLLAIGPGAFAALSGGTFALLPHAGRATFWFVWAELVAVVAAVPGGEAASGRWVRLVGTLVLAYVGGHEIVRGSEQLTLLWLSAVGAFVAEEVVRNGVVNERLAHPAVDGPGLCLERQVVAWVTLALFVLLLMPWPMAV